MFPPLVLKSAVLSFESQGHRIRTREIRRSNPGGTTRQPSVRMTADENDGLNLPAAFYHQDHSRLEVFRALTGDVVQNRSP